MLGFGLGLGMPRHLLLADGFEAQLGHTQRHGGLAHPSAVGARHQAHNLATTTSSTSTAATAANAAAAGGAATAALVVVVVACRRFHPLGQRTAVGALPVHGRRVAVGLRAALPPPAAAAAAMRRRAAMSGLG